MELKSGMYGKASNAKAAEGDKPVWGYIASLPQPQRGIAEQIDALAANTVPGLRRAVKWGMAYYGVEGGWCFTSGGFVGHVKVMFIKGTDLEPVPPVTPTGMGKATRGVEITSVDGLDEAQLASWMQQAATMPSKRRSSGGSRRADSRRPPPRPGRRSSRLAASAITGNFVLYVFTSADVYLPEPCTPEEPRCVRHRRFSPFRS